MNIYSNHVQRVQIDPYKIKHSISGFKNDLGQTDFLVAREMLDIYLQVKQGDNFDGKFGLMFDILKTMAVYLYPKPSININVSPGEAVSIPPELESKSSEELVALLPPVA